MKMEVDIKIVKGDGRDGLVDKLQVALIVGGAIVRPGVWRVTLERVPTKEIHESWGGEA